MIKWETAEKEFLVCDCGNDVMSDGFYPADPRTGEEVDPTPVAWDGTTYVCGKCGAMEGVL